MTTAIFDQDEIDLLNDHERRLDALEISSAATLHNEPGVISGGLDPLTGTTTVNHLIAGSIIAQNLYAGAIDAYKITANNIATGSLTADVINVESLVADEAFIDTLTTDTAFINDLVANTAFIASLQTQVVTAATVTAGIAAFNVAQADQLLATMITAGNISTGGLSAVSANLGQVTAGKVKIEGSTHILELGRAVYVGGSAFDGIVGYRKSDNQVTFKIDSETGTAEFRGAVLPNSSGLGNISGQIDGGTNIVPLTVIEGSLAVNSVTTTKILAGSVTATKITAGYVSSNSLSGHADVDFERTDALSLKGWINNTWHLTAGATFNRSTAWKAGGLAALNVNVSAAMQGVGVQNIPGPVETGGVWKTGVKYTLSATLNVSPSFQIGWYLGSQLGSGIDYAYVYGKTTTANHTVRQSITWTPTGDHTFAQIMFRADSIPAANNFYIDSVQVEFGTEAGPFSAASSGTVFGTHITPAGIETPHLAVGSVTADQINFRQGIGANLMPGSNFSDIRMADATSWVTANGAARWGSDPYALPCRAGAPYFINAGAVLGAESATAGYFLDVRSMRMYLNTGSYIGAVHSGFAGSSYTFKSGVPYTFSVYLRAHPSYNTTPALQLFFGQSGPAGLSVVSANVTPTSSGFTRYSVTWTPAADWNGSEVHVAIRTNASLASPAYVYVDKVQVEQGSVPTTWKQSITPTAIDANSVTSGILRTNATATRVQMDDYDGLSVWNSGVMTTQIKAGEGGLDVTATEAAEGTPMAAKRIRFLKRSDRSSIGDWHVREHTDGVHRGYLTAVHPIGGTSINTFGAADLDYNSIYSASLSVAAGTAFVGGGNQASITASAGGTTKKILDHLGTSDFVLRTNETRIAFPFNSALFENYGVGFLSCSYWKDSMGYVHVEGLTRTKTAMAGGEVIGSLPNNSSWTPSGTLLFAQDGGPGHCRVDVRADGSIAIQTPLVSGTHLALNMIWRPVTL